MDKYNCDKDQEHGADQGGGKKKYLSQNIGEKIAAAKFNLR